MEVLNLKGNYLSGRISPQLGNLSGLRVLDLSWNEELSGPIPAELGQLDNLEFLSLHDVPLGSPLPPALFDLAKLAVLNMTETGLTGPIPPELGNLARLEYLNLNYNALTGPIPPEFGNLAYLGYLNLAENNLTGLIPQSFLQLDRLSFFAIGENEGLCVPGTSVFVAWLRAIERRDEQKSLCNAAGVAALNLLYEATRGTAWTESAGWQGDSAVENRYGVRADSLGRVTMLDLTRNGLAGRLPAVVGNLAHMADLRIAGNTGLGGRLPLSIALLPLRALHYSGTGPCAPDDTSFHEWLASIPSHEGTGAECAPELGGLTHLRTLALQTNAGLSGALPASLTNLADLETLQAERTDLCAPSDTGFAEWLRGVGNPRVALCGREPATAYLVQSVQSREFPVPLVAGEEALLRVFVTAGRSNDQDIPHVRATFYTNGAESHVADIPGKRGPIPTAVREHNLETSANVGIPGRLVRPGLEMVIEVDPVGTLDPGLGVARRIPGTGRLAVEVREMPVFDLTLVPFLWTEAPDSSILAEVENVVADPDGHQSFSRTRSWLPVGDFEVSAHAPVLSSSNNAYDLIDQTRAIWAMEGGTGYYMGTMSWPVAGASGLGRLRVSFSLLPGPTLHELGHSMSLGHAPCGGAGNPDLAFPTPDASIDVWGYDALAGRLVHPLTKDIMSYCAGWISGYHFTKALRYRLSDEGSASAAMAAPAKSLLLWGGVDTEGAPYLEQAFVVDAPPVLPDSAGEYRIIGRTEGGAELFNLAFAMPEPADGDGSSGFAFVLPVRSGRENSLASITLSGPGGSFTRDGDSDLSVTILRNPRTGQVRGILRDLPDPATAAAFATGPGLEVLFSRGIPGAAAWRR